jgi:hypothetical protein
MLSLPVPRRCSHVVPLNWANETAVLQSSNTIINILPGYFIYNFIVCPRWETMLFYSTRAKLAFSVQMTKNNGINNVYQKENVSLWYGKYRHHRYGAARSGYFGKAE